MQALKGLVIGLGVLIVVGFVALIYGFYVKITDPDFRVTKDGDAEAAAPMAPSPPMRAGFGETTVAVPAGCAVADMRPDGERLYLRLGPGPSSGPDCDAILVVDAATGTRIGLIRLGP